MNEKLRHFVDHSRDKGLDHATIRHVLLSAGWRDKDIAEVVCPGVERKIIGIRPGEKLHEVLLTEEEAAHSREFDDYFVIEPEQPFGGYSYLQNGRRLPDGFKYTSDSNDQWLTREQLKDMLGDVT